MNNLRPTDIFNTMTDEDFQVLYEVGQLKSLCMALSLDLNLSVKTKNKSYTA
jgi:hypothetical protein